MTLDSSMPYEPVPAAEDDLSSVLMCVTSWRSGTRKTQAARNQLANHPLTREYLDAGLRLLAGRFRPEGPRDRYNHGVPGRPSRWSDWPSAHQVIDEVARGGNMRGNQETFDDRWSCRDYFIQDLLCYCLWARPWAMANVGDEQPSPTSS